MKSSIVMVGLLACFCVPAMIMSCNGPSSKYDKVLAERDSLKVENEIQEQNLNSIAEMIDTINSVLNSIAMEEGMLFITNTREASYAKSRALRDLERFEQVLRHQQDRINELDSLLSITDTTKRRSLEMLLSHLKLELSKKDGQIVKLRAELSNKNVDISKLREKVESQQSIIEKQTETIDEQSHKIEQQKKVIVTQDEQLNIGYVLISTRKELTDKGIAKRRKLLNEKELDDYNFRKVDIRKCKELSFKARAPRILTDMPKNSYTLKHTGGGNYVLTIVNPSSFWSVSNYLIVQTE